MTTLNTSVRSVPKLYRNGRIYQQEVSVQLGKNESPAGGTYTEGDGIDISASVISLDTNFIEVTASQGVELKYNGSTTLESVSGGAKVTGDLEVTVDLNVGGAVDITGAATVGGNIEAGQRVKVNTASGHSSGFELQDGGATKWTVRLTSADDDLGIYDGSSYCLYIDRTTGNVGINTTSPQEALHIYAATGVIRTEIETGDTSYAICKLTNTDGSYGMITSGDAWYIYDYTRGAVRLHLNADGDLGSQTFSSGFAGSGWQMEYDTYYNLTVDSLTVRRTMKIYELIINQIRATNGSMWVTDSVKVNSASLFSGDTYYVYPDTDGGDNPIPFEVSDKIRGQTWTGRDVKLIEGTVTAVLSTYFALDLDAGSDIPAAGDTLVRIGNASDSDRQGSIYITSNDTNAPYIDILDGVDSTTIDSGDIKARLGDLSGITDADFGGALSGYGLYSTNIYLKGEIVASGGEIAGWTIESDAIYVGTKKSTDGYSASGITIDSDGSLHGEHFYINSDGDCAFEQIEEAVFKQDGDNYGIKISGGHIWENEYDNDDAYVYINYKGYNAGSTRYRNTIIGDGKTQRLLFVDGGDATCEFQSTLILEAGIDAARNNITTTSTITSDQLIVYFNNSGAITVDLPASPRSGELHIVKRRGSGAVTLDGNGKNIYFDSDETTYIMDTGEALMLFYDTTKWLVIGQFFT